MVVNKRKLMGIFSVMLMLLFVINAEASTQFEKRMKLLKKLDMLDALDFQDSIQRANKCTKNRNFYCAEKNINKAKKYLKTNADRKELSYARLDLKDERALVREKEEMDSRLRRQRRRMREQEREEQREVQREEERAEERRRDNQPAQTSGWASGILSGLNQIQEENYGGKSAHEMINDSMRDSRNTANRIQREREERQRRARQKYERQKEINNRRQAQLSLEKEDRARKTRQRQERLKRERQRERKAQRLKERRLLAQQEVKQREGKRQKKINEARKREYARAEEKQRKKKACTGRFESTGPAPKGECGYVYSDYNKVIRLDESASTLIFSTASSEASAKSNLKYAIKDNLEKQCKSSGYDFTVKRGNFEHYGYDWKATACREKGTGLGKGYVCKGSGSAICGKYIGRGK
ncbi:MAG: hypothetical protein COA44_06570 [Arcobacter sp.]|nr:MAG: hypothetical protein COA44_06570 [Arcobacter sp.]